MADMRLIEVPADGIIRIPIMRGEDTVGERRIDLSYLPTVAAVEVVRCKDCDYKVFDEASQEYYCNHAFGMYGEIKDNDFCSYGERRCDNG